jgi:signal transduction histidine kinase
MLAMVAAVIPPALDRLTDARTAIPWDAYGPLWAALVLAMCAPIVLRRRFPVASAMASYVFVLVAQVLHQPQTGAWIAWAMFASAAYYSVRGTVLLCLAGAGWMACWAWVATPSFISVSNLLSAAVVGVAPVAAGYALRLHKERTEQFARNQRAEERTQIARDVHDVVGHHLSAIRMHAVGARRAPDAADSALGSIAEISAQALGEIRQLLTLLRDESPDPPTPTADLTSLVTRRFSGGGLRVSVVGEELQQSLPPAARYCVFRIVQESLTNIIRHSYARHATVRLERTDDDVIITVIDDGPVQPGQQADEGNGLRGMRERVQLLGGRFGAGPTDPHGWRVRAVLPGPGR